MLPWNELKNKITEMCQNKEYERAENYYAELIFFEHSTFDDNSWLKFIRSLQPFERLRMNEAAYFYYHICQPWQEKDVVRDELRLLGVTSLIELMMSEVEYKSPFEWLRERFPTQVTSDVEQLEEEYLKLFSITRKVKKYFQTYLSDMDNKYLCNSIQILTTRSEPRVGILGGRESGRHTPLLNINQVANFFYNFRSVFVHNADMFSFHDENCSNTYLYLRGKKQAYKISLDVKKFLNIFEKSFIKFWKEKQP